MKLLLGALAFLLALSISALARPIRVVALGDSLTACCLAPRDKAYPAQL